MELNPKKLEQEYNKEVASVVEKAGSLLRSKYGLWFLGSFSVVDSALGLPLSADPFMVAYMVANRAKAWWGFVITVAGSVLGNLEGPRSEHCAKDAHDEIERVGLDLGQIGRVTLLEPDVGEAFCSSPTIPRFDEVACDVYPKDLCTQPSGWDGRGAVAAPQVHHFEPLGDR